MLHHDVHLPDPEPHPRPLLGRREVLTGFGAGLVGAGAAAMVSNSADTSNQNTTTSSPAKSRPAYRTDFRFTPVIIAPADLTVTDKHFEFVRSLIELGNRKLGYAIGSRLRTEPAARVVHTYETEDSLASDPNQLASRLLRALVDSVPELQSGITRQRFVGFYIGNRGRAEQLNVHWAGLAYPDTHAALVLANPKHPLGYEDRVLIHESLHLLGYPHVDRDVAVDVMNPNMNPNEDLNVNDGYLLNFTNRNKTPPLIQQLYLVAPADIEAAIHKLYRTIGLSTLGSPVTGTRLHPAGLGYFQQFEHGVVTHHNTYGTHAIVEELYDQWNLLEHGFPTFKPVVVGEQIVQTCEYQPVIVARTADIAAPAEKTLGVSLS